MLHEEVELYSCLTGKDGYKTSISVIGAYLDGYKKGKAEAQPELCEDAVSRKAVLDAIDGWKWACTNSGHKQTESDIKLIRKDFIELPPVTPKQRTGKWISVFDEDLDRCSCCGKEFFCPISKGWSFCPNCGAEMKGDAE